MRSFFCIKSCETFHQVTSQSFTKILHKICNCCSVKLTYFIIKTSLAVPKLVLGQDFFMKFAVSLPINKDFSGKAFMVLTSISSSSFLVFVLIHLYPDSAKHLVN